VKIIFLRHNQMIEDTEIDMGGISFKPPERIKIMIPVQDLQVVVEPLNGKTDLIGGDLLSVIPDGPLKDGPAVGYLARKHASGQLGGRLWIIGAPVLFAA